MRKGEVKGLTNGVGKKGWKKWNGMRKGKGLDWDRKTEGRENGDATGRKTKKKKSVN